jgi:hypothetical protein
MKGKYKRKRDRKNAREQSEVAIVDAGKEQEHSGQEESETKTDNRKNEVTNAVKWWREPAHVIQVSGIFLGLIVAGIYLCQLLAMQEQVRLSRSALEVDQRAWVQLAVDLPKMEEREAHEWLDKMTYIYLPTKLLNIGKTPATGVHADLAIQIVNSRSAPFLSYSGHHDSVTSGVLFPDTPTTFYSHLIGDDDLTEKLTDEERQSLYRGDTYLSMFGRVTYIDGFGIEHWTQYCWWVGLKVNSRYHADSCVDYNQVDKNKEPK